MKALMGFVLVIFLVPAVAFGFNLTADVDENTNFYDVEVNDAVVANDVPIDQALKIIWNVDHLAPGQYKFRLRAKKDAGVWGSDWSVPFDATKPGAPSGVTVEP